MGTAFLDLRYSYRADAADACGYGRRRRFLNARDTLRALLDNNIVPVINENDAVATAEIKVGDNDNLSALAAILAGADKLLLLTDQQGLFTADPRTNPQAELIKDVHGIDDALRAIAGDSVRVWEPAGWEQNCRPPMSRAAPGSTP